MSEADRVFPARRGQEPQAAVSERRLIVSPPRKGSSGVGRSRVIEVVQVRRDRTGPPEGRQRPAGWNLRAETWPDGFSAKPAQSLPPHDIQPVVPEPVPPTVHVMPMWEPAPQQPAQPMSEPGEPPVETSLDGQRRPRIPKVRGPTAPARRFADPFADRDGGANCMRCGYLVEPAREKRGQLTCSACG